MTELNVILAVDKLFGIGINGKLPWNIKEELSVFKEKTTDSIVIIGRKTFENLPKLKNRTIFVISTKYIELMSDNFENDKDIRFFSNFEDALVEAITFNKKIFIAGGSKLYNYVFKKYKTQIKVHISFIDDEYKCDTYFDKNNLEDFYIQKENLYVTEFDIFKHCEMKHHKYGELQYLKLLQDIIENGERRIGRNGEVISDFCKHLKFDLQEGFPLFTTRKMYLKGIIEELLFFIRGDTNTKILEEKGINIWKGNTSREFLDSNGFNDRKEGEMGPMYGSIWRNFNGFKFEGQENSKKIDIYYKSYNKDNMNYYTDKIDSIKFNFDQLKYIINEIKTNPTSRRILMTSYNPAQAEQGVLYPCHSITLQFYVFDRFLDIFCYNRSSDSTLGLSYNCASTSLLLMIIAQLTNLVPRYVNISLGDVHIYKDHENDVKTQLERIPYTFPILTLPSFSNLEEVEKLTYKDFTLENYQCYPSIKMKMIA